MLNCKCTVFVKRLSRLSSTENAFYSTNHTQSDFKGDMLAAVCPLGLTLNHNHTHSSGTQWTEGVALHFSDNQSPLQARKAILFRS